MAECGAMERTWPLVLLVLLLLFAGEKGTGVHHVCSTDDLQNPQILQRRVGLVQVALMALYLFRMTCTSSVPCAVCFLLSTQHLHRLTLKYHNYHRYSPLSPHAILYSQSLTPSSLDFIATLPSTLLPEWQRTLAPIPPLHW